MSSPTDSGNNQRLVFWGSIALAAVVCLILIPLFPVIWPGVRGVLGAVFSVIDVRKWSQLTWFLVNIAVLGALVGVRFGPDWRRAWLAKKGKSKS